MDYYEFPKLLYIYAMACTFVYAFCSVAITLVVLTYSVIYKDDFIRVNRKKVGSNNKQKFKRVWERIDGGRLKRVLRDSDKIHQLYEKWVAESNSCVGNKTVKCSIEMATN